MEIPGQPGQRAYPVSKGRRGNQQFEGCHEIACRRPSHPCQLYGHQRRNPLTEAAHERTWKSDFSVGSGQEGGSPRARHKAVRGRLPGRVAIGPSPSAGAGTRQIPRRAGTGNGSGCGSRFRGAAGEVEGEDGDHPSCGQGACNRHTNALGVLVVPPGYRVIAQ